MNIDPIPFMANMARVACADGTLSPSELGQLEAIRQELKFKKGDFNSAVSLAQNSDYKLTPVGTFVDQVKNLELMLRVAYADNDLDQAEVTLVKEFCKSVGIHQDQLDRLSQEVLSTLKQQGKVCPSCGTENNTEARFCSKCGSNLESSDQSIQVQFEIPKSGIAIEFAESTATSFPKALEIAKATDGYKTCLKGKKTWHFAFFLFRSTDRCIASCRKSKRSSKSYAPH